MSITATGINIPATSKSMPATGVTISGRDIVMNERSANAPKTLKKLRQAAPLKLGRTGCIMALADSWFRAPESIDTL